MTASILTTMLGYICVSSFTPGPGNILAMNTTINYGLKRSKSLITGICCGYLFVLTVCVFAVYGLNTFLSSALNVLKYAGCIYMVVLAINIMRSLPKEQEIKKTPTFLYGFVLQLVNVKIYFYITTLLSVYLVPYIPTLGGLLISGLGVVVVGSIACLTWGVLGLALQNAYKKHYKVINIILGVFLLYCAYATIWS